MSTISGLPNVAEASSSKAVSSVSDPFDARGRESFDLIRDVVVPMRDGTLLATDLYLPVVSAPVPVIVERTGYGKDKSPIHWTRSAEYFASRGFAVAIQDVRGVHGSQGRYYPWLDDGRGKNQDGYDTIEWLAGQPWCSGKVGMFGGSYSGATQLRTAVAQPPHLAALVVRQAPNSPLQSIRPNGVYLMTEGGGWVVEQTRQALLQAVRSLEAAQGLAGDRFFRAFPSLEFHDQVGWVNDFLQSEPDDEFWKEWDLTQQAHYVAVPALHLGGWYDLHRRSTIRMFQACQEQSSAADDQRLVIGPWIHGSRTHADDTGRYVGSVDMGVAAKLDLNALSLQWFDHWLRGHDNGIMEKLAPVRYFMMGEGDWHDADQWPPPGARKIDLHLRDATLSVDPAPSLSRIQLIDHYDDPARTIGGDGVLTVRDESWDPGDDPGAAASAARQRQRGPQDQRSQESKGLLFTSDALDRPLRLAGAVEATVAAEVIGSYRPDDAAVFVRLTQIHPDGRSIDLVDGATRISRTDAGPTHVDLGDTAVVVPVGHRLRIGVYGSNFPRSPLRSEPGDLELGIDVGPDSGSKLTMTVLDEEDTQDE